MTTLPWRGRCSSWYVALSHLKFVLNKSQVQRSRHQFHYTYMLEYQSRRHGGLSGRSSFQVACSVRIPFPPGCMPQRGWALRMGRRSFSMKCPCFTGLLFSPLASLSSTPHELANTCSQKIPNSDICTGKVCHLTLLHFSTKWAA